MTKTQERIYELGLYIGMPLFLKQITGNYWIDMVKRPYTIIDITANTVIVQEAKCIFPVFHYDPKTMSDYYEKLDGVRVQFYDTLAESIEPDSQGQIKVLTYHKKRNLFGTKGSDADYPQYAIFGEYKYQPYLN